MIELGSEVKDVVTGFKGTVTGVSTFLNGCSRLLVQPRVGKDGKHPEGMWIDEPQLEITSKPKIKIGNRDKGGPMPSIPSRTKDASL